MKASRGHRHGETRAGGEGGRDKQEINAKGDRKGKGERREARGRGEWQGEGKGRRGMGGATPSADKPD